MDGVRADRSVAVEHSADVVVLGGGVVGLWTAVSLAARLDAGVVLIERGVLGGGTTGRAVGIIREWHVDPVWRRLASAGWREYRDRSDSWFVDVLAPVEVLVARPVSGAPPKRLYEYVFGPGESVEEISALRASPAGVMAALREAATGVLVRQHVRATAVEVDGTAVNGVLTTAGRITCGACVIACGGELDLLADHIVLPVRRQPVDVLWLGGPATGPVLLDFCTPGGLYLAPDRERWLVSSPPRAYRDDEAPDADSLVEAARSRLGRSSRVVARNWGFYDVTPDQRPIVGRLPGLTGCYVATGFAGSGLQVAPAAAELLTAAIGQPDRGGGPPELDPARFLQARL